MNQRIAMAINSINITLLLIDRLSLEAQTDGDAASHKKLNEVHEDILYALKELENGLG